MFALCQIFLFFRLYESNVHCPHIKKPGNCFLQLKCVTNTSGRVRFEIKMKVID